MTGEGRRRHQPARPKPRSRRSTVAPDPSGGHNEDMSEVSGETVATSEDAGAAPANGVAPGASTRDQPWVMRPYSGHSTAKASNQLYRRNLAKGQTGLSIAFDLPTQIGYDPDAREAAGEVGKVGVPVAHLGHMTELLDGIPTGEMNTSMTINATAPWLLGCYVANADLQGVPRAALQGTTQNDLVKEYLSRGTYIFPPADSLRC